MQKFQIINHAYFFGSTQSVFCAEIFFDHNTGDLYWQILSLLLITLEYKYWLQ